MKISPRYFWFVSVLALGGCSASHSQFIGSDPIRQLAASVVAARAFDRAKIAIDREDDAGLERAGMQLRAAADAGSNPDISNAFAVVLTDQAESMAAQADSEKSDEKQNLMAGSDKLYRAALAFAPTQSPEPEKVLDAQRLNALGYFLAERGQSKADYERAVVLTRASLKSLDSSDGISNPIPYLSAAFRLNRASGPQDSYAWALFKTGNLDEARKQEEEVLKTLKDNPDIVATSPEIPFHMAEIYRAQGKRDKALEQYQDALKLNPEDSIKERIKEGLHTMKTTKSV